MLRRNKFEVKDTVRTKKSQWVFTTDKNLYKEEKNMEQIQNEYENSVIKLINGKTKNPLKRNEHEFFLHEVDIEGSVFDTVVYSIKSCHTP